MLIKVYHKSDYSEPMMSFSLNYDSFSEGEKVRFKFIIGKLWNMWDNQPASNKHDQSFDEFCIRKLDELGYDIFPFENEIEEIYVGA